MPDKDMPKEVSIMGGCPVLGVSAHLTNIPWLEAKSETKATWLRAQQRGRVATRKKGRLRAALRHLRSALGEVCRPRLRPHNSREADSETLARTGKREGQPSGTVPQLPPKEKTR